MSGVNVSDDFKFLIITPWKIRISLGVVLTIKLVFIQKVQGIDGARQIAAYLKSQGVQLEFLVDEGTVIVKDAIPGMRIPFAL